MIHRSMFVGFALWLATAVVAGAETYTWTDDQGTVHFTEDAASVPSKHLHKARRGEGNDTPTPAEQTPAEPAPGEQAVEGEETAPAAKEATEVKETERFDFTARDQWQAELQKQEAAMTDLRRRIDDIAATVGTMPDKTTERDQLLVEHQTLRAEFKTMKDRYYRLVEAARKAGFQVDLQQ